MNLDNISRNLKERPMKILILGGTGMLGHRLWIELSRNHEVIAAIRGGSPFTKLKSISVPDVQDCAALEKLIQDFLPDVVINCIGLIKQAGEYENTILNIELNALLPNRLAKICKNHGSRLILFSTDCVFSGKKGLYKEIDFADADDVYGRTKKLGEIDDMENVLTLRTSIIGRELRGKASLVEWFLAQENKQVKGFTKAIFSGFPTKTIAKILEEKILTNFSLRGVYHLSAEPISKYDLISLIKEELNLNVEIIPESDFVIDRSLDSTRFRETTQFTPQGWKELIKDVFLTDIKY
jgi:dTDP-4-dehydrorhamnose reductase